MQLSFDASPVAAYCEVLFVAYRYWQNVAIVIALYVRLFVSFLLP